MNYMFAPGFIGTRAPFFMDVVTLIVALLPLLVYGAILVARNGHYKIHAIMQNIIFIFSVIIIGYFEMGVRVGGGFDAFISGSGVSHTYASVVLGIHILIATVTLFYWVMTVVFGNREYRAKQLPGLASRAHKKLAVKSFVGIVLTSFSGIWVYLLLFVY